MAIGLSIGRLQYKRARCLINCYYNRLYSSGDTNGKKLASTPHTYVHISLCQKLHSFVPHAQTVQFSVVPAESLQMQKQCYTIYIDAALYI